MAEIYRFSGHESFPCKSLWIKKGYDFIAKQKDFNDPNAMVELGVGKNMVTSIRYWLRAFNLLKENELTPLASYLFDDQIGKDKYIEDMATLWLLHFNLVFAREATLYNMLFCGLQRERSHFDRSQIINYIKLKLTEAGKQYVYNENTAKKDIGVLLQNYVLPRNSQSNEDYSSLLIDLNLIRQDSEGYNYYFNYEGKIKIAVEVFMYAILCLKENVGDNTISYEDIQENVGLAFCMQDHETIDYLKQLSQMYSDYLMYSDNSGIRMLQFIKEIDKETILDKYYANI